MSVSAWNTNRQLRRSQLKTPPLRLPGQSLEERISELQDTFMQDSIITVFFDPYRRSRMVALVDADSAQSIPFYHSGGCCHHLYLEEETPFCGDD